MNNQFLRRKKYCFLSLMLLTLIIGDSTRAKELKLIQTKQDALGGHQLRYNQTYQGIPVFGAQTIRHFNSDGRLKYERTRDLGEISISTQPKIIRTEALNIAKELWWTQFQLTQSTLIKARLVVYNPRITAAQLASENKLVWEVELYNQYPSQHEYYYIDAQTGKLFDQLSGKRAAVNRRIIDCSMYREAGYCMLDVLYIPGYTYGRSEGQAIRGANPWYLNSDVDNLYDFTGSIHNYYADTFGLNGANLQGGIGDGIDGAVTDTDVYTYIDSATPDDCPNAYYDGYSLNFCSGITVLDVAGHEYGHAFLDYQVPEMPYRGETGALHEAYADIFGEAVELYARGTNNWIIGDELNPIYGISSRNLADPTSSTDSLGVLPDRYYSPYFY